MRYHPLLCLVAFMVVSGLASIRGQSEATSGAERIAKLIKQLGDEAFVKREAASRELDLIGEPALPALRKAATSGDLEVRRRADQIIASVTRRIRAAAMKKALQELQGTWSLTSYETDGKQIKGEDKSHLFTVKGEKWSIHVGGQVFQAGTVQRIDVKEKVNAIDLLITEGGNVGATAVSIYALEGDSLKYLNCGSPRPAEFLTKVGDGRHYLTFRRAKP